MNVSISRVSGQSSDNWQTVSDVIQNPDQFSNSRNIGAIIEKLNNNISSRCAVNYPSCDNSQCDKERRQAIWLLSIVLFVYGWDNSMNRQRVINIMSKWGIDQSVFYEMEDTVETYKVITSEKDKNELDKSIVDLIELDSVVKEAEARETCNIFVLLPYTMKSFLRIWLLFHANVSASRKCSRFDNGSHRFLDYTFVSFYGSSSVG